ncbi:putative reverse transcriptase domain-containing protein [Tanacetum coccineum]
MDRFNPANFLKIHMLDFDVILGMDWLASHRATIDCYARTVIFVPRFLNVCQSFLVRFMDKFFGESLILKILLLFCEFADIFPDELPRLPPAREIEFGIELIPGAEPISKAPYRMAPVELKELKEQLQEMLENAFIRPCVFTMGCKVLFVKKKDGSMRCVLITETQPFDVRVLEISKLLLVALWSLRILGLCPSFEVEHEHTSSDCVGDLRQKEVTGIIMIHQWLKLSQYGTRPTSGDGVYWFCSDTGSSIMFRWFSDLKVWHRRKVWLCFDAKHGKVIAYASRKVGPYEKRFDVELCVPWFGALGEYEVTFLHSRVLLMLRSKKHKGRRVDDDCVVWFEDGLCVPMIRKFAEKHHGSTLRALVMGKENVEHLFAGMKSIISIAMSHLILFGSDSPDMFFYPWTCESFLDRQEKSLRKYKVIPFVKILWKNHPEREATWETRSMRA